MNFVQCQHPKASIPLDWKIIQGLFKRRWIAQAKINGVRVQLHVNSEVAAYTRHGSLHTKSLSQTLISCIKNYLKPGIYDGEWLRESDRIYLFDALWWDTSSLSNLTYTERHILLPVLVTPELVTLPLLKTVKACERAITDSKTEGLVFRLPTMRGWPDNAIIRCRKPEFGGLHYIK